MKLAILIIVKENYWRTRMCIENLIRCANGVELELFIYDNSNNKLISEYLHALKPRFLHSDIAETKDSYKYNQLLLRVFDSCSWDYFICIFQPNTFVNLSWAQELILNNKIIFASGISCIRNQDSNVEIAKLLDVNENFVNVWVSKENNVVNGVCVFKEEILESVGMFDEQLSEFELNEFAFRVARMGYNNHYIMNQFSTKVQ